MSTVHKLGYDLDRVTAFALKDQTAGFFNQFDGRSLAKTWVPPVVQPADTTEDDAQLGDCTVFGTVPLLSKRAAAVLRTLAPGASEFLPVRYTRAPLFVMNVLGTVDCLDESRSRIDRFETGRVMRITEYVFDPTRLPRAPVFRLPQLPRGQIYVSDPFVRAVRQGNLSGFEFTPLWSSDP